MPYIAFLSSLPYASTHHEAQKGEAYVGPLIDRTNIETQQATPNRQARLRKRKGNVLNLISLVLLPHTPYRFPNKCYIDNEVNTTAGKKKKIKKKQSKLKQSKQV